MRWDPPQKNPESSSGEQASCNVGFSHYLEPVSVLETHLYQRPLACCERLCLASVNVFGRLFQRVCSFHDGALWSRLPRLHQVCCRFWPKQDDHHALPSLSTCSCPELFFVSLDEESPQREVFWWCGRGKTKNGRSTKSHQNQQVQNRFWTVEMSR